MKTLRNDRGPVTVRGREVTFSALLLGAVVGRVTFRADREPLARDGGDPAGWWYLVRLEPGEGRMIDRSVPDGHFRTMGEAHRALLGMHGVIPWAP